MNVSFNTRRPLSTADEDHWTNDSEAREQLSSVREQLTHLLPLDWIPQNLASVYGAVSSNRRQT